MGRKRRNTKRIRYTRSKENTRKRQGQSRRSVSEAEANLGDSAPAGKALRSVLNAPVSAHSEVEMFVRVEILFYLYSIQFQNC